MAPDPRGLDTLRRWARLFDSAFRIPGTRITFGLDPVLGLIPGIGDLASPCCMFFIWHGVRLGVGIDGAERPDRRGVGAIG